MSRILIAEDEARLAAFIEKGLQRNGFETAIAENGQQALQMVESGEFELLLLDLGLPIKDGWTVLTELRWLGKQLPIIIVTAISDQQKRSATLAAGADDYVTKPFSFKDLLLRVKLQLE